MQFGTLINKLPMKQIPEKMRMTGVALLDYLASVGYDKPRKKEERGVKDKKRDNVQKIKGLMSSSDLSSV